MKFVLFVEGHTEHRALPGFLKRWLDARLSQPAGVQAVRFDGGADLIRETPAGAHRQLNSPKQDVIAVIALLDFYGTLLPYPPDAQTVTQRCAWAKRYLEAQVNHPRFRQFFAVHETEAWLLSAPTIFPSEVRTGINSQSRTPEEVNSDQPPAMLLDRLYHKELKRHYAKVQDGVDLFAKLDPEAAFQKCSHLRQMLEEMLQLAQAVGL